MVETILKGDVVEPGPGTLRPSEIESRSFAIIDSEVPEPRPFERDQWALVRRMIHTTADFELLSLVKFHPEAVDTGITAMMRGCLIVTDTEMARAGISRARIDSLGCRVECYINNEEVRKRALRGDVTRAHAAVDLACPKIDRGICVVGNAPTALMRLLDHIKAGRCRPALIVGMPVGFVNAAESKEALIAQYHVPYISIKGRKGGSALAACVVNQLAEIALNKGRA